MDIKKDGFFYVAKEEFWDACATGVRVATTGLCGGDGGHGSITRVVIENLSGMSLECATARDDVPEDVPLIEIQVAGDVELKNLAKSLRFAAEVLEEVMEKGVARGGDVKGDDHE